MSLRWYRRRRLVVLKPGSPVLDAARAIGQNRIGAVVVQEQGRVVGILTDRDLTTRVLAHQRDAMATKIGDVMTAAPATLSPEADVGAAIRLMQDRNIRRIPLVEHDRAVGMVTLDDLLLDEAAPLDALAAIVQSQIGSGGPHVARSPARRRSLARADATLTRLLTEVRDDAGFEDLEHARVALDIVLAALVRRLTPDEARDLIAQLPSLLQPALRALPPGPDKAITEATIGTELSAMLGVETPEAARILMTVASVIAGGISEGQAEEVRGQLPAGLRDAFHHEEPVPLFI